MDLFDFSKTPWRENKVYTIPVQQRQRRKANIYASSWIAKQDPCVWAVQGIKSLSSMVTVTP
jgi:hypothetical protein